MKSRESYGVLLSNLRSTAGLSQETLARCLESSKSALSRLENGNVQLPFKGSVRKLVLRLAELLCTSRKETERYLHLADIDITLLTEQEEIQLGFAPDLDAETSQESATLQRWESIYQQLIQQLQECETRLGNGKVPPPLQMKRQEYIRILQEVQAKLNRLNGQKFGLKAKEEVFTVPLKSAPYDDLASKTVETMDVGEKDSSALRLSPSPILESNGFFSFGKYSTSFIILDGDGTEVYHPANIRTFYNPLPTTFLEEIEKGKEEVEKEAEEKGYWNGSIYHLEKYVISREPIHEHMKLSLWFRPTDYYSTLSKRRFLQKNNAYLSEHNWENIVPSVPIPMGIGLCLLTEDGYILLAHRGTKVAIHPGVYGTGCSEGLSRPLDRSTISEAPDLYRCACRGLSEEFGLLENIDYSVSDIQFLSFGVDTIQVFYGLRGFIKLRRTSSEIINKWQSGVKDRIENKQLFALPFNPKDVCNFVFSHEPWGALVVIYHTLVHEFGREEVERVISSYL